MLVQVQKLKNPKPDVYLAREIQKDEIFKSKFFSTAQIIEKQRDVLETMVDFQVDLETSGSALHSYFRYSVVTWNSGNFYTIVSSNSLGSIRDFCASMLRPAIPEEFCYEPLPRIINNDEKDPIRANWTWRTPHSIRGEATTGTSSGVSE